MSDKPDEYFAVDLSRLRAGRGRDALWRDAAGDDGAPPVGMHGARDFPFSLDRREFLKLSAAALALAGAGCSRPPQEKILPYVQLPEKAAGGPASGNPVPGIPSYFATAMPLGGYGTGVLARSNDGRPTKVEGNPQHPASLGSTDVFAQASVLQLWDPDRSQAVRRGAAASTWGGFDAELQQRLVQQQKNGGAGLRLLMRPQSSPLLADQLLRLRKRFPNARVHQWEPLHQDAAFEGAQLAFGRPVDPVYRFDRAETILSIDADFLADMPGHLRYARDYIGKRAGIRTDDGANRLYVIESTPTLAGAMAEHRRALPPVEIERAVVRLAALLERGSSAAPDDPWLRTLAAELRSNAGRCLIVAGCSLSPQAHALIHRLNRQLGNVGRTLDYIAPVRAMPENCTASLRALCDDMRAGRVDMLIMLDGNPAYDAPADIGFSQALQHVKFSVHHALYRNETSTLSTWHLPATHYLEHWSDVLAFDGTASIVQPLIAPLYQGKSMHELLARLLGEPGVSGYQMLRDYWRGRLGGSGFEAAWENALRKGWIAGAFAPLALPAAKRVAVAEPPAMQDAWTVTFRADYSVRDGEFANNAWLQELPRPHSKLTWDNAAYISPASARELKAKTGDLVELNVGSRVLQIPVWVLPGQADRTITLPLGYGRRHAGATRNGGGFDVYPLRGAETAWRAYGASVKTTGETYAFATTQNHARMEDREPVRRATLAEYRRNPRFASAKPEQQVPKETLYPEWQYPDYRWGMAIDLNACIGCNACTIACQAENNIPTVGKEQVARGREMHWIRVDRYYEGSAEHPRTHFQPVPCMHCENAPCEEVCPVGATVHDSEGLNLQVYNRCVGTRFCSNNCPYKVRRFNFLQFSRQDVESLKAAQNPEVTVRKRGVMEKCTYCLQRITRARIETEKEGRKIRDGEVVTACQAVCPTRAIVFGDLNDPDSAVNRAKDSPRDYTLLAELNTRPRTTYQARLTNPHPDLEES